MKIQRTIYHLIVDKSGSMGDCINATINGYNEQLNRIKSMQAEFLEQNIRIGLTLFNDHIETPAVASDPTKAKPLTMYNYVPSGSTALYDAVGQTILQLEEKFANPEIPTTFVIVVLTDGYENSSRMFTLQKIRSMIQRLEATQKWTFSFIGATLDAVEVAEQMSIRANNSYSFQKGQMKGEVWDRLSGSMRNYMLKKRSGLNHTDLFDGE